jgi:hypothetical protein
MGFVLWVVVGVWMVTDGGDRGMVVVERTEVRCCCWWWLHGWLINHMPTISAFVLNMEICAWTIPWVYKPPDCIVTWPLSLIVYSFQCIINLFTLHTHQFTLGPVQIGFQQFCHPWEITELRTELMLWLVGPGPKVWFYRLQFGSVSVFFRFLWPDLEALTINDEKQDVSKENVPGAQTIILGLFHSLHVTGVGSSLGPTNG